MMLTELKKEINTETDNVTQVKYSPDGKYLAVTTGSKRYIMLFNLENDELKVYIS